MVFLCRMVVSFVWPLRFIRAAEEFLWGRYDLLPPSFPYDGMENPRVWWHTRLLICGAATWLTIRTGSWTRASPCSSSDASLLDCTVRRRQRRKHCQSPFWTRWMKGTTWNRQKNNTATIKVTFTPNSSLRHFVTRATITHCFGVTSNAPDVVCSGKGECVRHNKCRCVDGQRFFHRHPAWLPRLVRCHGNLSTSSKCCDSGNTPSTVYCIYLSASAIRNRATE